MVVVANSLQQINRQCERYHFPLREAERSTRLWGCWSSLADGCRQAILPDRCRKPPEFWRLWAPWVPPPYRYRPYPAPRCQPVTYERQLLAHVPHAIRDRLLELEGVALPVKIKKLHLTESPIPIFKYLWWAASYDCSWSRCLLFKHGPIEGVVVLMI